MNRRYAAIALALVLALLLGGGFVLQREATLQWAMSQLVSRADGRLQVDGVRGSLLSQIYAERVAWLGVANRVEAEKVRVEWSPLWLFAGVVAFNDVTAQRLTITSTGESTGPLKAPDDLRLPMRVRFAGAAVERLSLVSSSGEERVVHAIAFSFNAGRDRWHGTLDAMQTEWGRLRGRAELATTAPFALDASMTLDPEGRAAAVPAVSMSGTAKGTLSRFDLAIDAKAETSVAQAKLAIEPFIPQPVRAIDAALRAFDVRHLVPSAPEAVVDGTLRADTDANGQLRGTLQVANRIPGTLDAHRVPIATLAADVVAAVERWWLEGLQMDLGEGGKVRGTGWVTADETGFVLVTDRLDLHGLHAALRPTRLAGNVHTAGPFERQRMRIALAQPDIALALDGVFEPHLVTLDRARATARGGRFDVSGTLSLDERRAFTLKASLAGFDPSRFGQYTKAQLNGRFTAQGELAPVLNVRADGSLAPSTLFGLPASGRGRWASKGVEDPAIAFDVDANIGRTHIATRGTVHDPAQLRALDLTLALDGRDMAELYTITGLPFPSTPEYRVAGHVTFKDRVWSMRKFNGAVGRSDLSGDFGVDLRRDKPFVRAALTSQRLDIRDLGGFIGVDHTKPDPAPDRLLPQHSFQLDKLNAADVDLRFTGQRFRNERLPLERMTARLRLDGGRVQVDPLNFSAAGGDIDAKVSMDARRAPIATVLDVQFRRLQVARLAPGIEAVLKSAGTIDGRTKLTLHGNSTAAMMGSADGGLVLAMHGGAMSDLVLRLANLDIANSLVALARGDRNIPIRCLVGDFAANDGVLTPRTFVLDTEHTLVKGEGAINLRNEQLDVRLIAQPKDGSLLALRGPIRIDGTMKQPAVHPDLGNALVRGGAAIALAAVAPPAALLPLIQFGKPQSIDCDPLILDASRFIRDGDAGKPRTDVAEAPAAPARN